MAPESIGPLIDALSSQDTQVWALAEGALGNIGPAAKAAIATLEKRLNDKIQTSGWAPLKSLAKLAGPGQFVPVVIKCLPEVNRDNLDYTLDILVRYKEYARAAIPALLSILNKTAESTNIADIVLRGEVISALREIDGDTQAK